MRVGTDVGRGISRRRPPQRMGRAELAGGRNSSRPAWEIMGGGSALAPRLTRPVHLPARIVTRLHSGYRGEKTPDPRLLSRARRGCGENVNPERGKMPRPIARGTCYAAVFRRWATCKRTPRVGSTPWGEDRTTWGCVYVA